MKTKIFIQSEFLGDVALVEVERGAATHDLQMAIIAAAKAEAVSEPLYIFSEDEDDAEPLASLGELQDGLRLHVHRSKTIHVTVRYAGREARRSFRPSATIARIKKWAAHDLGVSPSDAAELMLQIAGTDVRPDQDTHVGSLVTAESERIAFDLVPAPRVNGFEQEDLLQRDLASPRFLIGVENGRWRLVSIEWPYAVVEVAARDSSVVALRFDCAGYPDQPPTAMPWDPAAGSKLPVHRWPTGGRVSQVFNPGWKDGNALYLPCDRESIVGHPNWYAEFPWLIWNSARGLVQYLEAVHELLQSHELVCHAA